MSIIVYGPQGCGKTLAAALLKRAFHLEVTWDDGNYIDVVTPKPYTKRSTPARQLPRLPNIEPGGLYAWARRAADFKSARVLFITCEEPPQDLRHARRIVAFDDALQLAVTVGIRTYLAEWPRGQAIASITARSLLEAIGVALPLHTKPLFKAVNSVMSDLGWIRVRLRAPGEPVTWAYRPSLAKEAAHV